MPLEIPDTQSPMRSSVTGKKVRSEGWMLKAVPAKVKDNVAFVVQGRVKPGHSGKMENVSRIAYEVERRVTYLLDHQISRRE